MHRQGIQLTLEYFEHEKSGRLSEAHNDYSTVYTIVLGTD
jgi:hypothetical protein